jgi:hypothetical protein
MRPVNLLILSAALRSIVIAAYQTAGAGSGKNVTLNVARQRLEDEKQQWGA